MKMNSLLVSLLVLSTILYHAQGIRLGKISLSSAPSHGDSQEKGTMVIKGSIKGGTGKEIICKDDEINCSGLNRKLMTKATTTTSKSEMNNGKKDEPKSNKDQGQNGKEGTLSVNPPTSVAEHREVATERYPDIIDIADYSPARRKPPIHN